MGKLMGTSGEHNNLCVKHTGRLQFVGLLVDLSSTLMPWRNIRFNLIILFYLYMYGLSKPK
jgi:hypothetical protein